MIKISVIVPAYNTERYINQCLTSIINQTLQEIEIIIINDASTDDTLKIIKRNEHIDKRIRVFNLLENRGNGYGRNLGIKYAKGQYIYFVDSDDYLDIDILELMYNNIILDNSQMLYMGYIQESEKLFINKIEKKVIYTVENLTDKKNILKSFLLNNNELYVFPWLYLFNKEFILNNNIYFQKVFILKM